jgi:hypothetical protein
LLIGCYQGSSISPTFNSSSQYVGKNKQVPIGRLPQIKGAVRKLIVSDYVAHSSSSSRQGLPSSTSFRENDYVADFNLAIFIILIFRIIINIYMK